MFINFYQFIVKISVRFRIIVCHILKQNALLLPLKNFKIKASILMIAHQHKLFELFDEIIDIKSE